MAFFVGSDTSTITLDFGLKIAGSMLESPLKLFTGLVDVNSLPAPTDPLWKEVLNQSVLSKLASQNEIPITSIDTVGRTAVWNGITLYQQGTTYPSLRDDYLNKTPGNTTTNPNIAKYCINQTSLQAPSSSNFTELPDYTNITTLNNVSVSETSTVAGQIPQLLKSFNLISEIEAKYGLIPVDRTGTAAEVLARQIDWLKKNVAKITLPAYIYGVCPTGNKAYLKVYSPYYSGYDNRVDTLGITYNVSSTPTLLLRTISESNGYSDKISTCIDDNGFIHFLAYTDAARTTDATLLVLTGHGLVAGDFIRNATRNAWNYIGSNSAPSSNVLVTSAIAGQIGGDTIEKYKKYNIITAGAGTTTTQLVIPNHGLSVGDAICNQTAGGSVRRVASIVDANTITLESSLASQAQGDTIWLYHLSGTQTAESTVIPSTIYVDYANIDIQLKAPAGYDLLVPQNPRRDAGLGNIVCLQKAYAKQTTDYVGKISGSVVENGNIAKRGYASDLISPSGTWTGELPDYAAIKTLDNSCFNPSTLINGLKPQTLFSLDVIWKFEKDNGPIPVTLTGNVDVDRAAKVAWLKSANGVSRVIPKWVGYGQCPSGYKAYFKAWLGTGWGGSANNTSSTPSSLTAVYSGSDFSTLLNATNDGFVHFIAYTDASDGVTASTIYTDYISLDIEYNNPNNAFEYFTGNSVEVESVTNGKAQAYMTLIDCSNLCTLVYGGSNPAFLSNFKNTSYFDIYAMGRGANSGVVGYGANFYAWNGTTWVNLGSNLLTSIAKTNCVLNNSNFIQNNNNIYLLCASKYASDGTLATEISLDYVVLNLLLNRTPDVIPPITVTL